MRQEVFQRALGRLRRAWKEAGYILAQQSPRQQRQIARLQDKKSNHSYSLAEVFDRVKNAACGSCGRCCGKAAMDSGYFSHAERQGLLAQGVDIEKYLVIDWLGQEQPPERCLFLSPQGCNIPVGYRSAQCLGYVCYDRLGPQLVSLNLEKSLRRQRAKLQRSKQKLQRLGDVPYDSFTPNLGEG